MKYIIIYLVFIFIYSFSHAQNLVTNPGFELYTSFPKMNSDISIFENWKLVKGGSGYFVRQPEFKFNRPDSFTVIRNEPRTGNISVGFYAANSLLPHNSGSVIQTQLSHELIKDHEYYAEVYLKLTYQTEYCTNSFWFFFSDSVLSPRLRNKQIYQIQPQIVNDSSNYVTDRETWSKISGTFKAKGGEKYMAFGSMTSDVQFKKVYCASIDPDWCALYLIDDFLVEDVTIRNQFESDTAVVLNNVYFDTGSYVLQQLSFAELDRLFDFMVSKTDISIEIRGHTDNSGNELSNRQLSANRAKAIYNYLVTKGISANRLTFKGYGSTMPITNNNTVENRQKNRRVDIKIVN